MECNNANWSLTRQALQPSGYATCQSPLQSAVLRKHPRFLCTGRFASVLEKTIMSVHRLEDSAVSISTGALAPAHRMAFIEIESKCRPASAGMWQCALRWPVRSIASFLVIPWLLSSSRHTFGVPARKPKPLVPYSPWPKLPLCDQSVPGPCRSRRTFPWQENGPRSVKALHDRHKTRLRRG